MSSIGCTISISKDPTFTPQPVPTSGLWPVDGMARWVTTHLDSSDWVQNGMYTCHHHEGC